MDNEICCLFFYWFEITLNCEDEIKFLDIRCPKVIAIFWTSNVPTLQFRKALIKFTICVIIE